MNGSSKRSLFQVHPKRLDVPLLIFASAGFLAAGLNLPILTTRKLWEKNTFSIISGITNLWDEKFYFLAAVIFFFSVVFPIVKLIALFLIWFVRMTEEHKKKALRFLSIFGKWSMLDVFVVAVLIVATKLGALASARAEHGIYYFSASILLAMIATALQNQLTRRPTQH